MADTRTNRGALALQNYFQSMKEVSKQLGIGHSMLSLLISGKRKPSIEVAAKLEKMFNIPCIQWTEEVTVIDKKNLDVVMRKQINETFRPTRNRKKPGKSVKGRTNRLSRG